MVSIYLPKEIIGRIVVSLPMKSMVRFKCDSKSWEYEVSLQLPARSRKVFALSRCHDKLERIPVVIDGQKPLEILTVSNDNESYIYGNHPVDIVGSCNGLICAIVYINSSTGNYSVPRPFEIILWNPVTEKLKELPSSGREHWMYYATIQHGFGYDAANDDYKVVRPILIMGSNRLGIDIYSLNSNSWRFVKIKEYEPLCESDTFGVFINDSIHWQTTIKHNILAVNLITEVCTIMEPPSGLDSRGYSRLGVSEDRLCLSHCYRDYIDYWMMSEYGVERSWTKLMRVQLDQIQGYLTGELDRSFKVPEYDEGSGKSLCEWSAEKVCKFDEIPSTIDYIRFHFATYSESLVSVFPRASPGHREKK